MKKIEISCPLTASMSVLGGKWKVVILWYLKDGPKRFTELKEKLPYCSMKMYNQSLKELLEDDILIKTVYPEVPARVEYELSEFGLTLLPIIVSMRQWGVERLNKYPELMADNESLISLIDRINSMPKQ